jgi:hypothetical protein
MMRDSPFNRVKKVVRRYGLGQEILRTSLDGPHGGQNIGMTGEKNDRQDRAKLAQANLKFRTAQSRYPHVEENTAGFDFSRQAIQQMLGRWIGRDLVAGFLQTTFNRRSEGSIVINYMHKPRQESLHAASHCPHPASGIVLFKPVP